MEQSEKMRLRMLLKKYGNKSKKKLTEVLSNYVFSKNKSAEFKKLMGGIGGIGKTD